MAKMQTKAKKEVRNGGGRFYDRPTYVGDNADAVNNWKPRNSSPQFEEAKARAFGRKTRSSFNALAKRLVNALP